MFTETGRVTIRVLAKLVDAFVPDLEVLVVFKVGIAHERKYFDDNA